MQFPTNKIQSVRQAPPPPELPVYGKISPAEVSFFGRTNYIAPLEEKKFIFGVKRSDRVRSTYVIGKSGVGKSKLLELLMRQDIVYGYGMCLIDFRGELVHALLDFIPERRVSDVCLIDLERNETPVAFNPLLGVGEKNYEELTQQLMEVMKWHLASLWTARLEYLFRILIMTVLQCASPSLHSMLKILTDESYRRATVASLPDDATKRFWEIDFPQWSEQFSTEAIFPIVNILHRIFSNPFLRRMFSCEENRIDFDMLIAEKRIVLVNCACGKLGHENASFFGSLCAIKLKYAGMRRAARQEKGDFYIYFDEFQHIAPSIIRDLISEAKDYGICLTFAHKHLGQLSSEDLAVSLRGGAGTLAIFRVSGEDAAKLESEMAPFVKAKDMMNLGTRQFYIKMSIDGEVSDPFSAETLRVLPPPHPSYREKIFSSSDAAFACRAR